MKNDILNVIDKFKSKEAVVGIVGLGYVGLPLMLRYNNIGFRVLGIDIDESKVSKLNAGESYIEHISAKKNCRCGSKRVRSDH
jgi:UDP-N-acetyl-D-glucosamine dehydrogenase